MRSIALYQVLMRPPWMNKSSLISSVCICSSSRSMLFWSKKSPICRKTVWRRIQILSEHVDNSFSRSESYCIHHSALDAEWWSFRMRDSEYSRVDSLLTTSEFIFSSSEWRNVVLFELKCYILLCTVNKLVPFCHSDEGGIPFSWNYEYKLINTLIRWVWKRSLHPRVTSLLISWEFTFRDDKTWNIDAT